MLVISLANKHIKCRTSKNLISFGKKRKLKMPLHVRRSQNVFPQKSLIPLNIQSLSPSHHDAQMCVRERSIKKLCAEPRTISNDIPLLAYTFRGNSKSQLPLVEITKWKGVAFLASSNSIYSIFAALSAEITQMRNIPWFHLPHMLTTDKQCMSNGLHDSFLANLLNKNHKKVPHVIPCVLMKGKKK